MQALSRQSDYPGLRFGQASMMGRNGQRVVEGRCKGAIPISDMVRRKDLRQKGIHITRKTRMYMSRARNHKKFMPGAEV